MGKMKSLCGSDCLLCRDGSDQAAHYFIKQSAIRTAQVEMLTKALREYMEMPDYDGTPATSGIRLRIKNQAKRALKAVHETESSIRSTSLLP